MIFDPLFLIMALPAFALGMWAQHRVKKAYGEASQVPAQVSGAAAARYILDSAGLNDVNIEQTPGHMTDHYDPRHNVLRLSDQVYHGHSQAFTTDTAKRRSGLPLTRRATQFRRLAIIFRSYSAIWPFRPPVSGATARR